MSAMRSGSQVQMLALAVHAAAPRTSPWGGPHCSSARLQSCFSGLHSDSPGSRHHLALLQLARTGSAYALSAPPPRRSIPQQAHLSFSAQL